jgi:hypothetical protein
MNNLPPEIQALIISKTDVPIDTYLYYKNIGAIPKKLNLENYDFIDKINIRRNECYKNKTNGPVDVMDNYYRLKSFDDDNKILQICVYMYDDIIKFSLEIYIYVNDQYSYESKVISDINTGKIYKQIIFKINI